MEQVRSIANARRRRVGGQRNPGEPNGRLPLRSAWLALVMYLLLAPPLGATTVIALRSPEDIVIAADSMTSGGEDFHEKGSTCKIRRVGPAVVASAGFLLHLPLDIDALRLAGDACAGTASVRACADAFTPRMLAAMGHVLAWSRQHDPAALAEYERGECFGAVFAGVDAGIPILLLRSFRCARDFQGRPFVTLDRSTNCPGDCDPWGWRYVPLGTARGVTPPIEYWQAHESLAAGARELVAEQERVASDRVGGPIAVVRVSGDGVACVECSPRCASAVLRRPQ